MSIATAVMPPTNSTVLAECTTQRASMQNVMSNMDANAPAFKCAAIFANDSLNDSNVSGYMTDSAQSTPSKELPAYSAAAPARYTHSPYGMDVMGSGSTFVPQLPSRMSAQFTRRQSQQAALFAAATMCEFNFHAPAPASPLAATPTFPAVQPNARRGKKNTNKPQLNKRPSSTNDSEKPSSPTTASAAATPITSTPASPTSPSKNIGRVYRNGRPVPVLPNGQPMFPADSDE